jgi:hypothetical protein
VTACAELLALVLVSVLVELLLVDVTDRAGACSDWPSLGCDACEELVLEDVVEVVAWCDEAFPGMVVAAT